MLVAITKNNDRVFAYDYDIAKLKRLSDRNQLRCPDCGNIVKVRIGKKVTAHFFHKRKCNCNSYDNKPTTKSKTVKKVEPKRFQQSKVCNVCNQSYLIEYVKKRGYVAKCGCNKEKPIIEPSCPVCGKKMFLRRNSKDSNYFWGCSRYPECKGTKKFEQK